MCGRDRIPGVPVASQEQALSTGKARGTPGSCHHSQSPPEVSVHSRETSFPCTVSTFKPRIDSHHGGTWDSLWESLVGKPRGTALWESLVGKTRGKATRESHRSLDPREGKHDTAARAGGTGTCMPPLETRTYSPGETPEVPQDPCQHWRGILRFRH